MKEVKTRERKEAIECFRLLAAVLVVFIHCPFPGAFGEIMNCLARIGVPFFFMLSGYFAYGAGTRQMGRRVAAAAKLNLAATGLFVLWGMYRVACLDMGNVGQWLQEMLSPRALTGWLVLNVNPFAGHLWYLSALLAILCVLYGYVRWQDGTVNYRPLYLLGAMLGTLQILLDSGAKAAAFSVPYVLYRNGLVWGFPVFCLGLFLREYEDRLRTTFTLTRGKLIPLILAGAGVSLLQWAGTGPAEMPLGTYAEAAALLLVLVSLPQISGGRKWLAAIVGSFGPLSTWIYVTHILWLEIYERLLLGSGPALRADTLEAYLRPMGIVAISILSGLVWLGLQGGVRRLLRRKTA